jgi:ribosomal protein S18 acetylase RimI-like enzyme
VQVEIRAATRSEIPDVLAVWAVARSAAASTADDETVVAAVLDHDAGALLVAVAEGRVVGTLIVGFDGWRGAMYRLGVVPQLRRRGIASRLVDAGHARLRALGARRVGAMVEVGEAGAEGLWAAAGYAHDAALARFVRNL